VSQSDLRWSPDNRRLIPHVKPGPNLEVAKSTHLASRRCPARALTPPKPPRTPRHPHHLPRSSARDHDEWGRQRKASGGGVPQRTGFPVACWKAWASGTSLQLGKLAAATTRPSFMCPCQQNKHGGKAVWARPSQRRQGCKPDMCMQNQSSLKLFRMVGIKSYLKSVSLSYEVPTGAPRPIAPTSSHPLPASCSKSSDSALSRSMTAVGDLDHGHDSVSWPKKLATHEVHRA
jgi:hypothetical protein